MASQGVFYPASAFDIYSSVFFPERIKFRDGSYAYQFAFSGGSRLYSIVGYDYQSFAIPDDATIDGIEIVASAYMDGPGTAVDYEARIRRNGTLLATNRAVGTSITGSDVDYVYGGPSDLWDSTWTPAIINASDFGAAVAWDITGTGGDTYVYVDAIGIRVYYTVPPIDLVVLRNHRMLQGMV